MANIKILLLNCSNECEALLKAALKGEDTSPSIVRADSDDTALEAMVSEDFHICLIRSSEHNRQSILEICNNTREAGLKIPLVVLMDIAAPDIERAFINAGAMAAMP